MSASKPRLRPLSTLVPLPEGRLSPPGRSTLTQEEADELQQEAELRARRAATDRRFQCAIWMNSEAMSLIDSATVSHPGGRGGLLREALIRLAGENEGMAPKDIERLLRENPGGDPRAARRSALRGRALKAEWDELTHYQEPQLP